MRAYAEVRNATTSRSWRCRVGGGLRRDQQRLQKTAKNTNRIPFAIETSLRARALEYRYITPSVRSNPRVCALSRGEDDVVDGDAAETKGKDEGQSIWRRGRKIGKPKKLERFDDEAPGGVEDRASLSIDRWRNALGERGSRRVRARGSFVRAGRDATSVEMTHSGRSLTRNPARRPRRPRSREAAGGRSFETRDRSRVECD